jgi:hypothetical protein
VSQHPLEESETTLRISILTFLHILRDGIHLLLHSHLVQWAVVGAQENAGKMLGKWE